ncbi:MAG: hypothetical protein V2A79_11520 [Planctomycetota bacterium]
MRPSDDAARRQMPVCFTLNNDRPALLIGSVASDTIFNDINQSLNTPKKRAAAFMQGEILPVLMKSRLSDRLRSAKLEYFGVVFVYGHKNFVREHASAFPESLCLVMSTRDYVAFVDKELSQEALLKNSSVFLAAEGPSFIRVELVLE